MELTLPGLIAIVLLVIGVVFLVRRDIVVGVLVILVALLLGLLPGVGLH